MDVSRILTLGMETPLGLMTLQADDRALLGAEFGHLPGTEGENPILLAARTQLEEYFAGTRREFALPLAPCGTEFRRSVWQALCTIPYGQTVSYGQLAAMIGSPKAARAVGGANHVNPISIIIPCHRVIGAAGDLVGYGGGLWRKQWLLDLEREVTHEKDKTTT